MNIKSIHTKFFTPITIPVALLLITFPVPALAAVNDFGSLVALFIGMIKTLVPLIVGLTLLYFMWGIFQLVVSNSEDSRKEAVGVITYGVVSLFVMISIWGLVSILTSTFFGGSLIIPQLR
ncbi:MAG: hypothetical protein KBB54_03235 [Candidatus Pacebacteria bacterium]|nr:hypothetical protein [Candidatus Paceibacterota bacterium]MBP9818917.1 hypothetical protein [Candidatus Paceibacterota bacterium]